MAKTKTKTTPKLKRKKLVKVCSVCGFIAKETDQECSICEGTLTYK